MVASLFEMATSIQPKPATWQRLPPRMRVLFVSSRERSVHWLAEALATDSASQVVLEEAVGTVAGLARLREEIFDAVLVHHEPGELDALDFVEGFRAGGAEEPVVVLGRQGESEMAALCYEVGADGYACVDTTTRNLIWIVARAVERHQLVQENQRLALTEQTRLQRERDEAVCIVQEQWAMLGKGNETTTLPPELVAHYHDLLRTYVIMGSGNLSDELRHLAELLVGAGLGARQTVELHLHVLQELLRGLGARSSRHVMIRADLLVLELLLHLADGYRDRCVKT